MIDTVKARLFGEWGEAPDPEKWNVTTGERTVMNREDARHSTSVFLHHRSSGLRVWGDAKGPVFCEASLPRLVYPHNGYLITDQRTLDKALDRLWRLVSEVVTDHRPGKWQRLDTVWQFEGSPSSWVFALQGQRVPFSRKAASNFFGESITWNGRKESLRIYDKGLECHKVRDMNVVRMELETKSAALRPSRTDSTGEVVESILRGREGYGVLSFGNLYSWYRSNVTQLPPFCVPAPGARSLSELLAYLVRDGVTIDGVPALEWYLEGRSRMTKYRQRKQVGAVRFREAVVVDLSELLPENSLPPVVHCVAV